MTKGAITRRQFAAMAGAGAVVYFSPLGRGTARAAVKITHAEAVETLYYLPLYVAHAKGFFEEQGLDVTIRSEEHTSELQSLMRISYAVFCLKKKTQITVQIHMNILIYS